MHTSLSFVMTSLPPKGFQDPPGPYTTADIAPGDPYELSNGYRIECMTTGGRYAGTNALGVSALAWDPDVKEAGVDAGYSSDSHHLRAPDIAIGNVPDKPGWIEGAPPLAVEYADVGQDEAELQKKIAELLEVGTKYLWVVRLTGPRRVEVYEPGKAMRLVLPGELLSAEGVLRNTVPVEALYDREAARKIALRNLLQSEGYADLDAVRTEGLREGLQEGLEQGLEQGLRTAVYDIAAILGLPISQAQSARLSRMNAGELRTLIEHLKNHRSWPL